MKSNTLKQHARNKLHYEQFDKGWYAFSNTQFKTFCTTLLEDYEDYMTDRISRDPGKIFDRKETIKEFLKQL